MKTIPITQGLEATVDDDIYDVLINIKWCAAQNRNKMYACNGRAENQTKMHWFVVGQPLNGYVVDHINRNGLDNRRENLRIVPSYLNTANTSQSSSSLFPGVYWHKRARKWASSLKYKGKKIYLGLYDSEAEAYAAYRNTAKVFSRELLPEHEELWKQLR